MHPPLSSPDLRHRKYQPLKDGGSATRRDEWGDINWKNSNVAIAKFLDVTTQAVYNQRKRRGIPPFDGVSDGRYKP